MSSKLDCAIAVCLANPGHVWLGRMLGLPVIRPIARFAYDRFADLLYAWNRRNEHWQVLATVITSARPVQAPFIAPVALIAHRPPHAPQQAGIIS